MARPLFRQEAIDAQRQKFLGEITIARPVPLWGFVLLAAFIAAALIAVTVWGQYTRRERVQGFLASQIGSVPMLISDVGQVKKIDVQEGEAVVVGQALVHTSVDRTLTSAAGSSGAVLQEITQRKTMLGQERDETRALGEKQVEQIRKRIDDLHTEVQGATTQIDLQKKRLASALDALARYENLANKQFVSDVVVQQKRDDVTDQQIKLQALVRERSALEKDLGTAQLDEPAIQLKTSTQINQLSRLISELEQSSTEERLLNETVMHAPIAGTVTNIAVTEGQIVAASTPFATIIPKDARVHVELLVPTRAIGFVRAGEKVLLRYESFPYERFGQYTGEVESVGKTAWMQGERVGPLQIREPTYRVFVKLDSQTVRTNDAELSLRPGMLVSADLLMEKRSLLEWLFQPLLQLRERIR
jgi:membrane fusion protein